MTKDGRSGRAARFFRLPAGAVEATALGVRRPILRRFLWLALIFSLGFAAWAWLRPYDWRSDPKARCRMVAAQVKQDRSYYWLELQLKILAGESHDLMKPVRLVASGGRMLEPADTTLVGDRENGTTGLWLKFWLEEADFAGPLHLKINDGQLKIRSRAGVPSLGRSDAEVFTSSNW
jgi:hypothetical protein